MKPKALILLIFMALGSGAIAATPVQVKNANASSTSLTLTFSSAVTAGNTLVLCVLTASSAPTSVTESASDTVNARTTYGGGSGESFATYDVLRATGGTISFTINVATSQAITAIAAEYASSVANAFDQTTSVATATSTSASSATLTPSVTGELAIGCLSVNSTVSGSAPTWSNSFVQESSTNSSGGVAPSLFLADQVLSNTSGIAAAATLSASLKWSMAELLYKPSGGVSAQKAASFFLSQ